VSRVADAVMSRRQQLSHAPIGRNAAQLQPSSAASAAIASALRAKASVSSVMVSQKCLATLRRPSTAPTFSAIAASPQNGLRARVVAALILSRSSSVAASRSSRLRARSRAPLRKLA
jgi:hypothetical protein